MNRLIFIVFALLFSQVALAQSDKKSFIAISAGPSFPIGDFKLKDLNNENSGLAETGGFLNISYGYKFSKYVGGMALLRGKVHGIDVSDYSLPDGSGMAVSIETTTWRSGTAMAGIFAYVPLNHAGTFHFGVRGLAGFQQTYSPEMKITLSSSSVWVRNRQKTAHGNSFSYLIGTDFKYHFTDKTGLVLSLDFDSADTKFKNVTGTAGTETFDVTSSQVISTLDLGLGLVIAF